MAIGEMMIQFMGRSKETHRIKNKPIGEGFKWFILATSGGFMVNFTPDGRHAAKSDAQEYGSLEGRGKVASMIMFIIGAIDTMKKKPEARIKNYNWSSTRASSSSTSFI